MATNTYSTIYSTTLAANQSTVTLNSFSGYTDIEIVANIKLTGTNGVYFLPNSDTTSVYSSINLYGDGSTAATSKLTSGDLGGTGMYIPGGSFSTSEFSILKINLMSYANTNVKKTAMARYSTSNGRVGYTLSTFAKTDAITTLTFGCDGGGSIAAGSTFTIYGVKAEAPAPKATGGAIYTDADYYYHVFGATGAFVPSQSLTADILTVAGGGGGGGARVSVHYAGGGGAGGVLGFASQSLTSGTSYTCTVGAGGTAGVGGVSPSNGGSGGNSQFGALTVAIGGGYGGTASNAGGNGGSGGGGGSYTGTPAGGAGTVGQGYAGGTGGIQIYVSGGGGGAGGVGATSSAVSNGAGGPGVNAVTNWGSLLTMFNATGVGVNGYIAGGGQGTGSNPSAATGGGGKAGLDSGGSGGTLPSPGSPNSGSGGAAGQANGTQNASNGGSGVIIVRYLK